MPYNFFCILLPFVFPCFFLLYSYTLFVWFFFHVRSLSSSSRSGPSCSTAICYVTRIKYGLVHVNIRSHTLKHTTPSHRQQIYRQRVKRSIYWSCDAYTTSERYCSHFSFFRVIFIGTTVTVFADCFCCFCRFFSEFVCCVSLCFAV